MMYYMHIGGQQVGPFEENQLVANGLTASTPVWCEGMANWTPASQVPALASLLPGVVPPPPVYGGQAPAYGYGQSQQPSQPMPETNLVWGILVTLFCCLPFGIVSIVKASQVSSLYNSGRYNEAVAASKSAGKWAMWGAISSVIVGVVYAIIIIALAASQNGF